MQRDPIVLFDEILNAISEIRSFLSGITELIQYKNDLKTKKAVERNLEIIGEAVKKIPNEIKEKYPDVEWRKVAGLRDFLIHGYYEIDDEVIWSVIENKMEVLKSQIDLIKSQY